MTGLALNERVARLRLFRSETVGPITFYRLLKRFGTAVQALEALPHMASKGGVNKQSILCQRPRPIKK